MADELRPPVGHEKAPAHLLSYRGADPIPWQWRDGRWHGGGLSMRLQDAAEYGWTYVGPLYPLPRADNPPGEGVVVSYEALLRRWLDVADSANWRSSTQIPMGDIPVAQDTRAMLAASPRLAAPGDGEVEAMDYWKEGAAIVEACLAKAQKADPSDAPMPLVGKKAALWHRAQAEAYRHALEMMAPPGTEGR
jgi:hypothetical protein